jgi:hypothetical protein
VRRTAEPVVSEPERGSGAPGRPNCALRPRENLQETRIEDTVERVKNMRIKRDTARRLASLTLPGLLLVFGAVVAEPARSEEAKVEIVDLSVDSANQPRFGQELKLRLTVKNKSRVPAKGVAVEVRRSGAPSAKLLLGDMGAAEQRILPLATGITLGAGENCFTVVPVLASGVPAGQGRPYCVTPGCYSVAERPGS